MINAGVSGETSSGALSRIEWVVSSLSPDIIILETGANDVYVVKNNAVGNNGVENKDYSNKLIKENI